LFAKPTAAAEAEARLVVQAPQSTEEEGEPASTVLMPSPTPKPTQEAAAPPETPPLTTPEPPAVDAPAAAPPTYASVTAIGDSVMLGAAYSLAGDIPGIDLDAAVGRQADAAIDLLSQKATAGLLGDVVVMHIGNNGTLTSSQFDQIMAVIGPDRRAIFLNLHVPRTWQDGNNAVIANGVAGYPNAVMIDWNTAGNSYPSILYNDGIHLTPDGAAYYAQLVAAAIAN
jgi:hypothetical protein